MDLLSEVRAVLDAALGLQGRSRAFDRDTRLLGAIPELDSMAVVAVITGLEERLGIAVNDDEIDGSTFATLGNLADFAASKLDAI
jgi:acyl carrier protein